MNWTITRQQQEIEQASLKQGWQQLTTIAVEHMELGRAYGTGPRTPASQCGRATP